MGAKEPRLELYIDVFPLKKQRALVLPTLMPEELALAIIQEFGGRQIVDESGGNGKRAVAPEKLLKLAYLSDNPNDYQLLRANGRKPLDATVPIGAQLSAKDQLILTEQDLPLPEGTTRPSRPAYLRDQNTGKVFKLHWLPAIIGRSDPNLPQNDRLAVNLSSYRTGQRVSRRHAQIGEAGVQFYVEPLSPNPTAIKYPDGKITPIKDQRLLRNGETVLLEGSQIALEFIVRDQGQ